MEIGSPARPVRPSHPLGLLLWVSVCCCIRRHVSSRGSSSTDTSDMSIQGRRYASDGSPLGDQFQVNTYTTDYQLLPSVSAHADGDFLVVWGSNGSSGTDPNWAINGQRYASDGTTIGDEFQVNTSIVSYQLFPSVSVNPDGGFAVVWQSEVSSGTDSSSSSIQGQRYAALFADGFESGSTSAWSRTIP